jgi:hypothetical protein
MANRVRQLTPSATSPVTAVQTSCTGLPNPGAPISGGTNPTQLLVGGLEGQAELAERQ